MTMTIQRVQDNGKSIKLSDGSEWEIDDFNAFHTRMWTSGDKIEASFVSLTNISRSNKKVSARRK